MSKKSEKEKCDRITRFAEILAKLSDDEGYDKHLSIYYREWAANLINYTSDVNMMGFAAVILQEKPIPRKGE